MAVQDYLRVRKAIRLLGDPDERDAAHDLLVAYGPQAVPALIQALHRADEDSLCATAEALGQIGDDRALLSLGQLAFHGAPRAAASAARAMGHIGDPRGVDLLAGALGSKHGAVRLEAALSLARLATEPELSERARQALARLQREDVPSLCGALLWGLEPVARDVALVAAAGVDPDAAATALATHLEAQPGSQTARDALGRREMVEPLINLLTAESGPRLLPILADIGSWLLQGPRSAADADTAVVLGRIADATAELFDRVSDAERAMAVDALQALGEWAVGHFRQHLLTDEPAGRLRAASILKRLDWDPTPDEAGARYWIAHEDWESCERVGEAAIGPLVEELTGPDPGRRDVAAGVLLMLGWHPADRATELVNLIALHRWEELSSGGDASVSALADALRGERRFALASSQPESRAGVRLAMVRTLSKPSGREAAAALAECLGADSSFLVREEAQSALVGRGAEGVEALVQALQRELQRCAPAEPGQPDGREGVRCDLVHALAQTQALEPLDVLLRTLGHDPAPAPRAAARDAVCLLWRAAPEDVVGAVMAALGGPLSLELGQALQRLGPGVRERLLEHIRSPVAGEVRRGVAGLVALGSCCQEDVFALLREPLLSGSPQTRRAVVRVLDRLSAIPDDPEGQAAYWLAKGDLDRCEALGRGAVPVLVQALPLYGWPTAGAIALALVRLGLHVDDPALAATLAELEGVSGLEDGRITQGLVSGEEGLARRQEVTLEVSREADRRLARKLLTAIHSVHDERVWRYRENLKW